MQMQNLNGMWERRVGGRSFEPQTVPFSTAPVGYSCCRTSFDCDAPYQTALLRFEGVAYEGRVTLNGHFLGSMLAYCRYDFDVSGLLLPKNNTLVVELEDMHTKFGPSEGWENYSGIIREVQVLYYDADRITDVFFHAKLQDNYTAAEFYTEITATGEGHTYQIILTDPQGQEVYRCRRTGAENGLAHHISDISLWSPDTPNCYTLTVELWDQDTLCDTYVHTVGFYEIVTDKRQFLVNGQPFFFYGVCRHELYGNMGHALTYDQVYQDMLQIKNLGCNYVRLVHYPHHKQVLDIADRMGLFVSEEPGLWNIDVNDTELVQISLEVLRRTMMRDRNHPCVAFWLCFNECVLTKEYLDTCAKACREIDPYRLVSGANFMNNESTKELYTQSGIDFYTQHPYGSTTDNIYKAVEVLDDKPLLFTEWGGWMVYDNPNSLRLFIRRIINLAREGRLAGASYWCWAEYHEFSRAYPASTDGITREGLVDIYRNPTMMFETFKTEWQALRSPKEVPYRYTQIAAPVGKALPLPTPDSTAWDTAMQAAMAPDNRWRTPFKVTRDLTYGPKLRDAQNGLLNDPFVVGPHTPLQVQCSAPAGTLRFVGMTGLPCGYPITNTKGAPIGTLRITYQNGQEQTLELLNGVHLTTVFATYGPSRIRPLADALEEYACFGYDAPYENYVIQQLSVPVDAPVASIEMQSLNDNYILLYAILQEDHPA